MLTMCTIATLAILSQPAGTVVGTVPAYKAVQIDDVSLLRDFVFVSKPGPEDGEDSSRLDRLRWARPMSVKALCLLAGLCFVICPQLEGRRCLCDARGVRAGEATGDQVPSRSPLSLCADAE